MGRDGCRCMVQETSVDIDLIFMNWRMIIIPAFVTIGRKEALVGFVTTSFTFLSLADVCGRSTLIPTEENMPTLPLVWQDKPRQRAAMESFIALYRHRSGCFQSNLMLSSHQPISGFNGNTQISIYIRDSYCQHGASQ